MNKKNHKYLEFLQNANKPVAFVLGSYITGLGVIRSFGRRGIPLVGLDSNPKQIGFYSKYCVDICHPPANTCEEEYIELLISLGGHLKQKGVLIPTTDMDAIAILKYRKELESFFYIPMPPLNISQKLLNKKIFYQTLSNLKIPHPATFFPENTQDLKGISSKLTYPCVVKPVYSGHFRFDFNTKLFVAKNLQQLTKYYTKALEKKHDVIIQEIIPGSAPHMYGYNAYYTKNFVSQGSFMYQRVREWPHTFGNGCLIKPILQPELEKTINNFIKKIKYYGIVDAEFKKDPRDNLFKLIEINARPWMQNSLPARCGIDFSYLAYMDAIGQSINNPNKHPTMNIRWLLVIDDVVSSFLSMSKGSLTLSTWVKSLAGKKEFATYAADDPLPAFVLLGKTIYDIGRYLSKKQSSNSNDS